MPRCALMLIAICFSFAAADARTTSDAAAQDSAVQAIRDLYDRGSYIDAEIEARRFLEQPGLPDSMRIQAEQVLAFALVAQGKPKAAVMHFRAILDRDPAFELDPLLTSPKILAAFNEAKEMQRSTVKPSAPDTAAARYAGPLASAARSVSWRVLVFPGWEQLHQDRPAAGYALLGAGAAAAALSLGFEIERASARKDYLAAASAEQARVRYDRYNRAYKKEVYAFAALAAVYLISEIDAFINLPHSDALSLALRPGSIGLSVRF